MSVIVASVGRPEELEECLVAILSQADTGAEVLVVGGGRHAESVADSAGVRWLEGDENALVPELWGHGIRATTGVVVLTTTSSLAPKPGWIDHARRLARRSAAALPSTDGDPGGPVVALGGGILPPSSGSIDAWATWFLRYCGHHPDAPAEQEEPAADNAAYLREEIVAHPTLLSAGFWEPEFHRRMKAAGGSLAFEPAMTMELRHGLGVGRFVRQRLRHGRRYGAERGRAAGTGERWLRVLASPLVPFVLIARVGARARRVRGLTPKLLRCLPLVLLYASAWAIGEARGMLEAGAGE